ncbi:ATP synthase F1 [Colletotrichum orchidophilum]|uniref:Serine protease n=1 Tax=Colletotrichum orchidophilum TaxID=1209926 RepID=A0A1G4AUK5_9PEZI|nr:ATP synthase F1 [Colletotrichum orchidophilum]OHE92742.1 ATP synthase F1 [Colletotrichum orchidophilum]
MSHNAPASVPRAAVWSLKSSNPDLPAESAILPDDGSNGTESVFDDDKRRRVEPQNFADGGKFRSVVKIQACFNKGSGGIVWMMGSGWLISPDTVVTAGHVVYDWGHRLQSAIEIKCYIGYSGRASVGTPNVQARFGERIITTAEWIEAAGNRTHDVAFIKLNRPFTGNLRNIPFKDTPLFAKGANIGVVGYPGDKYLEGQNGQNGEKGAQMYEEFAPTDYNIEKSERHMIEYQVSTFAGQSGAPIFQLENSGLVSIGTHCYGGGGDESNSGNSIGGPYGNNYHAFLALFESNQFPQAQRQGIKVLNADTNARPRSDVNGSNGISKSNVTSLANGYGNGTANGNSNDYNGNNGFRAEKVASSAGQTQYNTGTGLSESSDEEGFFDIIRSIAKVAGPAVKTVSPFLGPIGGPIGAIAGGILSTVGGAESAIVDGNASGAVENAIKSGATERAVLAEASLQALLKLEDTPETAELLHTINSKYSAFRPKLDAIAKVAQPQLTECGLHLAHRQMAKIQEQGAAGLQESEIELPREQLRGVQLPSYTQQGSQGAFVQGLLAPTRPVSGEEGFFDFLGPVLTKGIGFAKPFITSAAQGALNGVIGRLGGGAESSLDTPAVGTHEHATCLAFKRAAAAEAALQTLMALPKEKLDRLRISEPQNGEEGFFDVIKAGVQKIAPAVLDIAKTAMRKVVPVIVDAASQKIKNAVGPESAPAAPRNNVPSEANYGSATSTTTRTTSVIRSKPSVADMLAASAQAYKGAKVSNNPDDSDAVNVDEDNAGRAANATLEDLLKSRESTWVPSLHRHRSWDSNDDGLCMMDEQDF